MQTRDTIAYLERFAPSELGALRSRHPDAAATAFVSTGETLGAEETAVLLETTRVMLASVGEVARVATGEVSSRLRSARKLELLGNLIGMISSGAVVAVTVWFESIWGGTLFGALSFVSAAIPQVVNWLRQADIGTDSAVENLVKLRGSAWDARRLLERLAIVKPTDEESTVLIDQGNAFAKEISVCLSNLGYDVTI